MRTAMAKTGGRMVYATSAGDPAHFAYKALQHAEGDPMWRVSELRGPAPWLGAEALAEQKRALHPSIYARLFLNVWSEAAGSLATVDQITRACVIPLEDVRAGVPYVRAPVLHRPGHRVGERFDGGDVRSCGAVRAWCESGG